MEYICSKKVFVNGCFQEASIGIENGKIMEISAYGKGKNVQHNMIIPGLIDVHTHGGYGCDCNEADEEKMRIWLSHLPSEATTSLLITPYTSTLKQMQDSVALIDRLSQENLEVSVLGAHLEGPFISQSNLGAMNGDLVLQPSTKMYQRIVEGHEKSIKLMSMACEIEGADQLMRHLQKQGVVIATGHSGLTYEEGQKAKEKGLLGFTHTYNGMRGLHHREAGTVGCSLLFDECYSECICDGYHVSYPALEVLFRCKPIDKVVLVSDSLCTKGLPEGIYWMDGEKIEMRHGCAYLYGTNQLSGSTLSMLCALQNVVRYAHVPLEHAIMAASCNPASYLKIEKTKGYIAKGNDADLCILDSSLDLLATYHQGKLVYER